MSSLAPLAAFRRRAKIAAAARSSVLHHRSSPSSTSATTLSLHRARPWARFLTGRAGAATASALMIRSGLGTGAWDSVAVALHDATRLGVGTLSTLVSLAFCLLALALGVRPTVVTVATAVIGGIALDIVLPLVPTADSAWLGGSYYAAALVISGLSSALYLSARLGHTPYDGVVTGLRGRHGWGEGPTRIGMELPALALAWGCGGPIGLGTFVCTVAGGPAVATGMRLLGVERKDDETEESIEEPTGLARAA